MIFFFFCLGLLWNFQSSHIGFFDYKPYTHPFSITNHPLYKLSIPAFIEFFNYNYFMDYVYNYRYGDFLSHRGTPFIIHWKVYDFPWNQPSICWYTPMTMVQSPFHEHHYDPSIIIIYHYTIIKPIKPPYIGGIPFQESPICYGLPLWHHATPGPLEEAGANGSECRAPGITWAKHSQGADRRWLISGDFHGKMAGLCVEWWKKNVYFLWWLIKILLTKMWIWWYE